MNLAQAQVYCHCAEQGCRRCNIPQTNPLYCFSPERLKS